MSSEDTGGRRHAVSKVQKFMKTAKEDRKRNNIAVDIERLKSAGSYEHKKKIHKYLKAQQGTRVCERDVLDLLVQRIIFIAGRERR